MTPDTEALRQQLSATPLAPWAQALLTTEGQNCPERHGDFARWQTALERLPDLPASHVELDTSAVTVRGFADSAQQAQVQSALMELHPWRKGPFKLHGVTVDTEWRSDLKWNRVQPAVDDLRDRCVLDIGCGSGYHLWRMLGDGARLAIGIDPTPLFVMQFRAVAHFICDPRAWVLPLAMEELPEGLSGFDSVFSMGILYHRRDPLAHLKSLWQLLRPGGQLILETLVVSGDSERVLVPEDRYAQMRNVWFIPSCAHLLRWLRRSGFVAEQLVDETVTTDSEQRSTPWMRFDSLGKFLDPDDSSRTIEGYPAPCRAVITARRPA